MPMTLVEVFAHVDKIGQYRRWLREYLAAHRIEYVDMEVAAQGLASANVQRFHRVQFRTPDGEYHTLDVRLRRLQDATSEDTADDVSARIAAWVKHAGWAEKGRVV